MTPLDLSSTNKTQLQKQTTTGVFQHHHLVTLTGSLAGLRLHNAMSQLLGKDSVLSVSPTLHVLFL
jgi:hypothetical protein